MDSGYINMPEGDDYENSGCFQPAHRPENEASVVGEESKKRPKTGLIVSIAAAAAVVLGAAAFFLFRPGGVVSGIGSPKLNPEVRVIEETVNNFADAYNDGDFDALCEYLDSDTRGKINNIKLYGSIISRAAGRDIDMDSILSQALGYASFGASFDIQEMKTDIDGDTAKVDARLIMKSSIPGIDGDTERDQSFSLVKEDGKWYISGLK